MTSHVWMILAIGGWSAFLLLIVAVRILFAVIADLNQQIEHLKQRRRDLLRQIEALEQVGH